MGIPNVVAGEKGLSHKLALAWNQMQCLICSIWNVEKPRWKNSLGRKFLGDQQAIKHAPALFLKLLSNLGDAGGIQKLLWFRMAPEKVAEILLLNQFLQSNQLVIARENLTFYTQNSPKQDSSIL